ncbi:MAG: hypothetical protein ACE5DQ_02510, partial [Candidatus Paceibacterota bacterium]
KAEITCSTERDGEYFLCGADEESKTRHAITTNVLLNPDIGYYVNIIIGDRETPAFISAHEEGAAFGADFGTFESGAVGSCVGDKEYDAALDFNQDGCVNLNDAAETL